MCKLSLSFCSTARKTRHIEKNSKRAHLSWAHVVQISVSWCSKKDVCVLCTSDANSDHVSQVWSYLLTHKKSPWASRSPIGRKTYRHDLSEYDDWTWKKAREKAWEKACRDVSYREKSRNILENKSEAVSGFSHERICALCCRAHPPPTFAYRGRILGRHRANSLQSFLLAIHSHLCSRILLPPPLGKWFETNLLCK